VLNEDQIVEGVGVVWPTYAIIHDKCVQESKEEPMVNDDSLRVVPHPLHPDNPCDSTTANSPYENPLPNVSTSNHSQDTSNISLSS